MNQEQFERIIESKEIIQLITEVSEADPSFARLPKNAKLIAAAKLMEGEVEDIKDLTKFYLKRDVPTIEEFLTPEYLGETSNVIFPIWRKDLAEVFAPDSTTLEWALTGAIGTGKTTAALIAHLYNLYRINSLRRPQLSMGSDPTKAMNLQLFTVTAAKAESTLVSRVRTFLGSCKNYVRVKKEIEFLDFRGEAYDHITPWCEWEGYFIFPNNIRIASGSQSRHALGEDVFGGLLDEAEFRRGLQYGDIESTFELYRDILERIRSRFLRSKYILMTILSSIKHSKGVMAEHLREVQNKPTSKVSQYSIWDARFPNAIKEEDYFWVMRGTQRHPSHVLNKDDTVKANQDQFELPPNCEILKVPNTYREDFENRVEQSLMNLAGKVSLGHEIPFDDLTKVEDPLLCPVLYLTAPLKDIHPLRTQLPKEFFIQTTDGYRFRRYPGAQRYGHADLADTGEAGLAIVHKELSMEGKVIYVGDFVVKITSPNRISLDAVRELIIDLKNVYGLSFATFTADQYQSTQLLQKLQAIAFCENVGVLSMDRNRVQYDALASVVSEDCLKLGMMRELKKQLENIYFEKDKPYSSSGHKGDIADALCGAVYNATTNPLDIPHNVYEGYGKVQDTLRKLETEFTRI
jgi:hypothetical protein